MNIRKKTPLALLLVAYSTCCCIGQEKTFLPTVVSPNSIHHVIHPDVEFSLSSGVGWGLSRDKGLHPSPHGTGGTANRLDFTYRLHGYKILFRNQLDFSAKRRWIGRKPRPDFLTGSFRMDYSHLATLAGRWYFLHLGPSYSIDFIWDENADTSNRLHTHGLGLNALFGTSPRTRFHYYQTGLHIPAATWLSHPSGKDFAFPNRYFALDWDILYQRRIARGHWHFKTAYTLRFRQVRNGTGWMDLSNQLLFGLTYNFTSGKGKRNPANQSRPMSVPLW